MRRLIIAMLVFVAGCSSATASGAGNPEKRNVISPEEIQRAANPGWSAYDLIYRTRPEWLRSRSPQTLREPDPIYAVVYLDDIYHGELDSLKDITISRVASVQFINAYDTTARFGQTFQGGAIMVRTH